MSTVVYLPNHTPLITLQFTARPAARGKRYYPYNPDAVDLLDTFCHMHLCQEQFDSLSRKFNMEVVGE